MNHVYHWGGIRKQMERRFEPINAIIIRKVKKDEKAEGMSESGPQMLESRIGIGGQGSEKLVAYLYD